VFWAGVRGIRHCSTPTSSASRSISRSSCTWRWTTRKPFGFKGQFYIEPKPKEPTKHQYDSDAAACLNFLREFDLLDDFQLNIETNHATLAGHSMLHELTVAATAGRLGSIDANVAMSCSAGTPTSSPPTCISRRRSCSSCSAWAASKSGGLNFDAKVRRESFEPVDLFHAHIGGMDALARGLKIAAAIRQDGALLSL